MNLAQFKVIAPKMDAEIDAVFKKYGFERRKRSASVNESTGEISYRVTVLDRNHKGADGKAATPERETWRQLATLYGLEQDWLDREIAINTTMFKIVGLRGKASKNCICIARITDGKSFVCSIEQVERSILGPVEAAKRQESRSEAAWEAKVS